MSMREKIV